MWTDYICCVAKSVIHQLCIARLLITAYVKKLLRFAWTGAQIDQLLFVTQKRVQKVTQFLFFFFLLT